MTYTSESPNVNKIRVYCESGCKVLRNVQDLLFDLPFNEHFSSKYENFENNFKFMTRKLK